MGAGFVGGPASTTTCSTGAIRRVTGRPTRAGSSTVTSPITGSSGMHGRELGEHPRRAGLEVEGARHGQALTPAHEDALVTLDVGAVEQQPGGERGLARPRRPDDEHARRVGPRWWRGRRSRRGPAPTPRATRARTRAGAARTWMTSAASSGVATVASASPSSVTAKPSAVAVARVVQLPRARGPDGGRRAATPRGGRRPGRRPRP